MSKQDQKKAKRDYFNRTSPEVVINRRQRYIVAVIIALVAIAAFTITLVVGSIEAELPIEVNNTSKTIPSSQNTISNGGFDFVAIGDNLQYPNVAKGWTVYMETNRNSVAGVLDTSDWNAVNNNLTNYGISIHNPDTPRNTLEEGESVPSYSNLNKDDDTGKIFMIHNLAETYAYVYSTSFTIPSNTWYKISFYVMTLGLTNQGAFASLYDSTVGREDPYIIFRDITTEDGVWTRFEMYVEGNKSTSKSGIYFSFGLGSKATDKRVGTLFIDNIVVEKGTIGHYKIAERDIKNAKTQEEKLRASRIKNYSFETTDKNQPKNLWGLDKKVDNSIMLDDFTRLGNYAEGSNFYQINAEQYRSEAEASTDLFPFEEETKIFVLNNRNGTADGIGVHLNRDIEVYAPNNGTYYRISFYIRTLDVHPQTGAYIYLLNPDNLTDTNTNKYYTSINTTSEIEDHSLNGWVMYNFYFKPGNIQNFKFELELFLGRKIAESSDKNADGKLYIANFEYNEIEASAYTSATNDNAGLSLVTKLDLATASDTNIAWFNNGQFYSSSSNTVNHLPETPNVPSDWKRSTAKDLDKKDLEYENEDYSFGIVYNDIGEERLAAFGLTYADFPLNITSRNQGMLYLNNKTSASIGVMSNLITLEANSYYHISVLASALPDSEGDYGEPYVYISGDINACLSYDTVIGGEMFVSKNVYRSVFSEKFYEFNFYIATGEVSKSIYLELFNGIKIQSSENRGAKGIALFSNAWYESMTLDDFTKTLNEKVYESLEIEKHKEKDYEGEDKTYFNYSLAVNGTEIRNKADKTDKYAKDVILNNGIVDATALYSNVMLISYLEERIPFADADPEVEEKTDDDVSWFAGYFKPENLFQTLSSIILVLALLFALIAVAIRKSRKRAKAFKQL